MKALCLSLMFSILCAVALSAPKITPEQARAMELTRYSSKSTVEEMTAKLGPNRDAVFLVLRKMAQGKITMLPLDSDLGTSVNAANALGALLRLHDQETIETLGQYLGKLGDIQERPYGRGRSEFGLYSQAIAAKQPALIRYLSKGLFLPGRVQDWDGSIDEVAINRSKEAMRTMLMMVLAADEFSPEAKAWARSGLDPSANQERVREVVREWWKANEAAFLAEHYTAVKPGRNPLAPAPSEKAPSNINEEPPPSPPYLSAPAAPPSKVPGNAQTPDHSGNGYLWSAALLLALCGSLVWLLRRKRT